MAIPQTPAPSQGIAVKACNGTWAENCETTPRFALIKLNTGGVDCPVFNTVTKEIIDTTRPIRVEIDSNGCLNTGPLLPNSQMSLVDEEGKPCSYYEILIVEAAETATPAPAPKSSCACKGSCTSSCSTTKQRGEVRYHESFLIDNTEGTLPHCVDLMDVLISGCVAKPSSIQNQLVKSAESPWLGIQGCGIELIPGDHPDGLVGNGHSPTLSVAISDEEGNEIVCLEDGLYVQIPEITGDIFNDISINNFLDFELEGCDIGNIPVWNGSAYVCGVKAQVAGADGKAIETVVWGAGSIANPWTVQSNVVINPNSLNLITCDDDGLLVLPPVFEYLVDPKKATTVELSGSGFDGDPLTVSVDVNISTEDGQILTCLPDGLYVPDQTQYLITCFDEECNDTQSPTVIDLALTGSGTEADPWVLCPDLIRCDTEDNLLELTDEGIKVSCDKVIEALALNAGGAITVDIENKRLEVCISPLSSNILTVDDNGCLFVPELVITGSETRITGVDNKDARTFVNGSGTVDAPYEVNATINISSDPKNVLTCLSDGLFANSSSIIVDNDPDACIELAISGCGLADDPFVIKSEIKISDAECQALFCEEDGLFVKAPDGSETIITTNGGECATLTISGLGTFDQPYVLTSNVVVEGSPDNRIICTDNGLYVAPADGTETNIQGYNTSCVYTNITGSGSSIAPYVVMTELQLSGNSDQMASCTSDGLIVRRQVHNASDGSCTEVHVTGNGSPENPWETVVNVVVNDQVDHNMLECTSDGLFVDTPYVKANGGGCLHLESHGLGTADDPICITGQVIVDPSQDNLIYCDNAGLRVDPKSVAQALGAYLGNCLEISGDCFIDVSIDDVLPDNQIRCTADGLYVAAPDGTETVIQLDTGCGITGSLLGSGSSTNPYVINVATQIAPNADNLLKCTSAGLYAPATQFHVDDSGCIFPTITGLGTEEAPYILGVDLALSPESCQALRCTGNGLYVEDRGYVTLSDHCVESCILVTLTGDGSCGDAYELYADLKLSTDPCNTAYKDDEGLIVPASGLLEVVSDSCLALALTGSGSKEDPYSLTGQIVLDNECDSENLLTCSDTGLSVTANQIINVVANALNEGINITIDDDGNVSGGIAISDDENNCLRVGSDFGLFVPCPDGSETVVTAGDTSCVATFVTGAGTADDPYLVFSEITVKEDTCNAITCTPEGLYAENSMLFEIGQDGCLAEESEFPYIWRAPCDGKVSFTIATHAYGGSIATGTTHFKIKNQSGATVYTGQIASGGEYEVISLDEIEVVQGQGFFAVVCEPIPETQAIGLAVQGEFTKCNC